MKLTESNSVNLAKPLAESAVAPGECGSVPEACVVNIYSSGICKRGTKCCVAYHSDAPKRAVSRMQDSDYQTMMAHLGMPNSKSLLLALRQVANWTEQAVRAESGISSLVGRPNEKDVVGEGK